MQVQTCLRMLLRHRLHLHAAFVVLMFSVYIYIYIYIYKYTHSIFEEFICQQFSKIMFVHLYIAINLNLTVVGLF